MKRQDFRFLHRLRVRWAEVDMQKIVFNAHYLMYVDTAVADYWRALALPYEEAMHLLEGDIYVKKATVEFHASARWDDRLDVGIRCSRIGTSSMGFTAGIFRGEDLLISCELVYVFADPATQTSRPVPEALRRTIEGFEAGQPVVEVRAGDWATLGPQASALRQAVFIEEQHIPPEMEWEDADQTAVHAVAFNRLGQPVATGRLLQAAPGIARIGRMAAHRVVRGAGVGREVLLCLMALARERGDTEAVLSAQVAAQSFYAREGFVPRGPVYDDAGIPHIEMGRSLVAD